MPNPRIRGIEHLKSHHDLSQFRNERHTSLDEWLKARALYSEGLSARTYVVCGAAEPRRVVGYYAIATAQEERTALSSANLRRNMPDKVPLLILGRLAVDAEFQGAGLGTALLNHALRNCLSVSEIIGARGVMAQAIDDEAVRFYERLNFRLSPLGERMMFLKTETLRKLYPNTSS